MTTLDRLIPTPRMVEIGDIFAGVGGAAVIAFVPSYARAASQNPTPLVIPSRIKNSTTRGGVKIDRIVGWAWGDLSMNYLGFPQKRK